MIEYAVRGIGFHPDGLTIEYAAAADIRDNGLLLNHSLFIPADGEFADPLDEFIEVVHGLLKHALDRFDNEPPADVGPLEDDDSSPYDNPLERPGVRS